MKLIDPDELRKVMYHEAFETDSDMQKWDSGCWIRYKMFEKAIDFVPTIDAVPVVRCKDCENFTTGKDEWGNCCENPMKMWRETDFCSWAERKTDNGH